MCKTFLVQALKMLFVAMAVLMSGMSVAQVNSESNPVRAPLRFLITFDDGPSGAKRFNATKKVLNALKSNSIQPDIKAVFFTQTRAARGGGTEVGQLLLQREFTEGHLLAFHSSTKRHSNHRFLTPNEFDESLKNGIADLTAVCGVAPRLVRPPFWSFDARTLATYHQHGLQMLLTDLSANDGVIWGVNWSWHKHSNFLKQLTLARKKWLGGEMPIVNGVTPIVVTFHDVNNYTARNVEVYLNILLQVAHELEMPVSEKPFYDDRNEIEIAALARTMSDANSEFFLPGIWSWLWK